jgi:phosphoglycerate dehydrogenase-like enzyme
MSQTRTIRTVLATVPYTGRHIEQLREALEPATVIQADRNDAETIARALEEADVAVLGSDLDDRFLRAPRLKWIHCDHSGLNESAKPGVFERGLIVTGSAGRSAPVLAEHALFLILSLIYDSPGLLADQKNHVWRGTRYADKRGMFGRTMGIIGLGYTGKELAVRAKLFGMKVLGYRRSDAERPEGVDVVYCADKGEAPDALLRESDIIVLCARLCDETYHMIGEREIALMKPGAFLINMARGAVVDENALAAALRAGRIAGAGADTFETEPLPADSGLWDAPNMIITPHCTPEVPDLKAEGLRIIRENIRRYKAGEPMLNMLTPRDVYTQGARKRG